MMYDELVKRPRLAKAVLSRNKDLIALLSDAADAVEELSRRETPMKITEIHVDEYFCPACGAENNCDQGCVQDAYCPACGQRLLPEPPKEETE